jgi:hypothetical protein
VRSDERLGAADLARDERIYRVLFESRLEPLPVQRPPAEFAELAAPHMVELLPAIGS